MPLTRKITLNIHEAAYPALQKLAAEYHDANINRAVRQLIYQELVRHQLMSPDMLLSLWGEHVA